MRILEGAAAARYVRKLEQRGQKLDALEPQVRRIVQSVGGTVIEPCAGMPNDGMDCLRRFPESVAG